jgi:hypothetical protein
VKSNGRGRLEDRWQLFSESKSEIIRFGGGDAVGPPGQDACLPFIFLSFPKVVARGTLALCTL